MSTQDPAAAPAARRPRIATVWLAGCSGCHMSFLDLDEWLFELSKLADVVYSPVADVKEYPENVDAVLVEGAVANVDNLELIRKVRARTGAVIAFGDCAITGNVTALRNRFVTPEELLRHAYVEEADVQPQVPGDRPLVPELLPKVLPVHQVVKVDAFLHGCPPPPHEIRSLLETLLGTPGEGAAAKMGKEENGEPKT